ncbi:putative Ig domain-containing protein [Rheinheimera soli]|uniref:Uncharacterized protein n=1 Tax=Rheinheimera soli TaxID=443616 RepID=A0ABU1W3D2_9GAMM|nr:putative Ig domain-containing protein [Rheinheimera soli]MDR7122486.1 hypothetical protein [Rheinheimera soli]
MFRVKSMACAIAVLLSTPLSALEIPLYEQIPNSSLQAESPQPLVLSNKALQQESFVHLASTIVTGHNLIAASNNTGFSLVRFTDGQYTLLKDYTFKELDLDSGSVLRFNSDASVLFIRDYNEVNAFSVAPDGSLSKLATHSSSNNYRYNYGSEGNSYISSEYSQSGYNLVLNSFNASANRFTSKDLVRQPNNMNFAVYDESKNLLIVGSFSYSSYRHEVKTYKGDAFNQFSLISTIELPSGSLGQDNVAYSSDSGNLFIATGTTYQFHVQDNGVLQQITNNSGFNLPNSYPRKLVLSANKLFASYNSEIHALSLTGTTITGKENLSNQYYPSIAQLGGNLLTLHNEGLHYYSQGFNAPRTSLQRGAQGLAWVQHDPALGQQIQLAGNYLLRSSSQYSELYKADSAGKLSIVRTYSAFAMMPEDGNGQGTIAKLSDTTIITAKGNKARLLSFDTATERLTLIKEIDLNKLVPEANSFNYSDSMRMLGSHLLVRANSKLHLFQVLDNTLSYLDTAVAGVNNVTAIPELTSSAEFNGKLYIYNNGYNAIHELSVENNRLKQKEVFEMPSSGWGSTQVVAAGQQLHVKSGSTLYVFQQIDSKFTLLSLSNINSNPLFYIDKNFALNQYNSDAIEILQFDKTSGIPEVINDITVDDSWYLRNAFMFGPYLYLQNSESPAGFIQFMVNRAPDLTTTPAAIALHEGVSYSTELAGLVSDADAGNTVVFSLVNAVTGITLSEQGTLSYDGSALSASTITVRATDNTGLYSDITLTFNGNKAPVLSQEWIAPALNQNQAFLLDLNEFFVDPEGSVLSYEITSTAALTVTAKGIVSGTITTGQAHQLNVVVKDNKGAISSHTLPLNVNAAPVLSGSGSLTMFTEETVSINLASLFTDAEGQSISFSAMNLPAGLTLSGSTISGKVTTAGSFSALITATDSAGATSQATLNFVATQQPKSSGGSSGWISVFALIALVLGRRFRKA